MAQPVNEYAKMTLDTVIAMNDELWQVAFETMGNKPLPIIRNPMVTGVTLAATLAMGKALGDPLDKIILSNTIGMVAGVVATSLLTSVVGGVLLPTIGGIAIAVAAATLTDNIYDNWPDIKTWTATQIDNFTNQVVTMTQDIAQAMAETLQEMGDFTVDTLQQTQQVLHEFYSSVVDKLSDWSNSSISWLNNAYDSLVSSVSSFATDVATEAFSMMQAVGDIGDSIFSSTKSLLNLSQKIFDPLVIDLGKDGITLISYEQSNAFVDLDNDGFKDHAGWVGKNAQGVINDGLVFEDKNGNGKADGIVELVGGDDGTGKILGAFDELHQYYNTNDDLYFDSKDAKFNTMKLWIDANGNGTSETSEVSMLKSKVRGIYIPLDVAPSGGYSDNVSIKAPVFDAGNLITIESYVDLLETGESTTINNNFDFGDGSAKEIYFGTNTSFNAYTRPSNLMINQNALAMPNLRQSGANNTGGTPYWVAPLVDAMSMTTSQHGLNGAGILIKNANDNSHFSQNKQRLVA